MRDSVKSLPVGIASARRNFSSLVGMARGGQRIKLTRHGKNIAWVVGADDREALRAKAAKAKKKRRVAPGE